MSRLDTDIFDARIAEWLEDDPDAAPSQVLEVVRAAVPSVAQRRRLASVWPTARATRLGLAAAAAIVVLLVGRAVLTSRADVGAPSSPPAASASPTPGPTAAPQRPTEGLQPYTSALYGYTIDYPVEWTARAATSRLPAHAPPWADDPTVDLLEGGAGGGPFGALDIASVALEGAETLETWTASVVRGLCGEPASTEAIELDGEPALLLTYAEGCNGLFHIWVTVVHDGTATHIVWLDDAGREAADRELFDDILATFRFPPDPSPSSSPS